MSFALLHHTCGTAIEYEAKPTTFGMYEPRFRDPELQRARTQCSGCEAGLYEALIAGELTEDKPINQERENTNA